jgi:hypothetical protein
MDVLALLWEKILFCPIELSVLCPFPPYPPSPDYSSLQNPKNTFYLELTILTIKEQFIDVL